MADAGTGSYGNLHLDTSLAPNAVGNYTDISWAFYLQETGGPNVSWDGSGTAWSLSVGSAGTVGSGTFTWDWRPGGLQSTLIASGTTRIAHNPDGTPPAVTVTGNMGNSGTSGAGGPSSVSQAVTLSTLTVAPLAPTTLAATRVSDTQASLAWTNNSATNGVATTQTVQQSVNGGAFATVATISAASTVTVSCAANQKLIHKVNGSNTAGVSPYSANSNTIFTTPATPTSVVATKVSSNISIAWTDNVAFTEHTHVLEHGTITGGTTTWDGSPLATIASGTTSYTHTAPSTSFVHVYRLTAKNTDTAALASTAVISNSVQLLVAPNAPTLPLLGPNVDKASAFTPTWTHNPIDSTAQTAYEFGYSTNGGTTWSTTGKVTSAVSANTFAANTYAANVALTVRVRTWGIATTGGSDGTGASAWSSLATVTFKSLPVVTIVAPANAGTYMQAALAVQLGFSQAESAVFVSATLQLYSGATLLEQVTSTTLSSTAFVTPVANLSSYTVKATLTDSNGLVSAQVTSTFSVAYTLPMSAVVVATYLSTSGIAQLAITIPSPTGGFAAATGMTIDRAINGISENVVTNYPTSPLLTILDTTPTISGDNVYTITTISAIGATAIVTVTLTTAEGEWAFMSKGAGYTQIVRFGGELKPQATPSVDAMLVKTSGRARPIGLYATTGGLGVSGTGEIVLGYGSSPSEVEAMLLVAGKGCYRDPTGRRMFGLITGSVTRDTWMLASFAYTVTETS